MTIIHMQATKVNVIPTGHFDNQRINQPKILILLVHRHIDLHPIDT